MTREQELQYIQQARAGDQCSLTTLINEVIDSTVVRTFASKVGPSLHMNDADDILLLTREMTWRFVSDPTLFDPERGRLAAVVWTTVRNRVSNMLRAEKRRGGGSARVELSDELLNGLKGASYRREEDYLDVETTPDIDRVRSTLPKNAQRCMKMLMAGYTLQEIANDMSTPKFRWSVGRVRTLILGPIRDAVEPIKEDLR